MMRGVCVWAWYLRTNIIFVRLEGMMQVREVFVPAARCGSDFSVTVEPHAGTAGDGGAITGGGGRGGGRGGGGGGGRGGSAVQVMQDRCQRV